MRQKQRFLAPFLFFFPPPSSPLSPPPPPPFSLLFLPSPPPLPPFPNRSLVLECRTLKWCDQVALMKPLLTAAEERLTNANHDLANIRTKLTVIHHFIHSYLFSQ